METQTYPYKHTQTHPHTHTSAHTHIHPHQHPHKHTQTQMLPFRENTLIWKRYICQTKDRNGTILGDQSFTHGVTLLQENTEQHTHQSKNLFSQKLSASRADRCRHSMYSI